MLPPLADRIRPQTLAEFVGQKHLVDHSGILRKLIKTDQLVSMIFWGPPGSGKTSLAQVIANETQAHFVMFSAVTSSLDDIRKVVKEARARLEAYNQRTILFIDEIHRFNKAQQDAFLPHVEKGTIILIGATTENPSFEIIGPLLSRCKVLVLNRLNPDELSIICNRGLSVLKIKIKDDAKDFLLQFANGDARVVLNALELAKNVAPGKKAISLTTVQETLQSKLLYDRLGEEHYNTISAFIKSLRASNVDAALYYLARMVEAGEDPLFIARRMVIFASEDIGMAQPTALVVANEVFRACETIGYPECAINLAHGVVYLAKAPKDRSAYNGLRAAQEDVKKYGNLPIPLNLRNPVTKLMKDLDYGKDYKPYASKDLLPDKIKGRKYFQKEER
ncbi:replication-associated recombination protein A [Candidatus Gottesmanbacteria bacterium]|nr:replication-associated recombination protein A [Candidatus Gottesmanbacteria bacterium]